MNASTNTNNVTVNMENLSATERAQLIALMEKANGKVFVPTHGQRYYFAYSDGDIDSDTYGNSATDNGRIAVGNCYKTREDAQFAVERTKVIRELQVLANGFKPAQTAKWYTMVYDNNRKSIRVIDYGHCVHNNVYFPTEQAALDAINNVGADRLLKYYFCVA